MEVILLEKVGKLGDLGDTVSVKSGFGRNFLLPGGKAVSATKDNVAKFDARRADLEKAAAEKLSAAQSRADKLAGLYLSIPSNAGEEGKLFGSIGTRDIADCITKAGAEVSKSEVKLPKGAIRELGDYEVDIQLHSDITQTVTLHVIPE